MNLNRPTCKCHESLRVRGKIVEEIAVDQHKLPVIVSRNGRESLPAVDQIKWAKNRDKQSRIGTDKRFEGVPEPVAVFHIAAPDEP